MKLWHVVSIVFGIAAIALMTEDRRCAGGDALFKLSCQRRNVYGGESVSRIAFIGGEEIGLGGLRRGERRLFSDVRGTGERAKPNGFRHDRQRPRDRFTIFTEKQDEGKVGNGVR